MEEEEVPALVQTKARLLTEAHALLLPGAPLDVLLDALGGPGRVAEMTGRKGRVVRVRGEGGRPDRFRYAPEGPQLLCKVHKPPPPPLLRA